jgi:hypothetical protein
MGRSGASIIFLLIVISVLFVPLPSNALNYNLDHSLSNVDASFWGENANDASGVSVANAGDVNGDGYDDILIGAYGNSENGAGSGQAYLIFGKASGWSMDADLSNANASFLGEHAGDALGVFVDGAGDVNGDGYDDILIGAYGNSESAEYAGQTYLIFGKPSGWFRNSALSLANASFRGESANDCAGQTLAGVGDVNGDGYDDFLIGAQWNNEAGNDAGQTYLILGKSSGWSKDTNLSKSDASFLGEQVSDEAGFSVNGAGDVNGDGYDDFLIGTRENDDGGTRAGQTYLMLGKPSGWAMDTDLSNSNASFVGENSYDGSGASVSGVGDVNGDGYDDILIGANWNADGGSSAGQTYLVLGKASGWAMDTDLSTANASFWGEETNDFSGYKVADAGDVNGDGYDDFLIGAYCNNEGGSGTGQTYLILGKPSGWAMDRDLSNSNASFWGEGTDWSGKSAAGGGDMNGDGYDDILIGALWNSAGGDGAGQTYLVFPETNSKPSSINSVKAYTDDTFSSEKAIAFVNDTVYIELKGTDGDSNTVDIAVVNVKSNVSNKVGFHLTLIETGKNTGTYRGNITISNRTRESKGWIKSSTEESVNISSVQAPSKYAKILVGTSTQMWPLKDNSTVLEDTPYKVHYWANQASAQWKFQTNASWLTWNATTHNISGLPTNADVGSYYVMINVSRAIWGSVEHNFTLTVNNTLPNITTTDITLAVEETPYSVNYNSSDDGQGTITYHMLTDAGPWLSLDKNTGLLSGTPANDNVGVYFVNISVDDGNKGWDWSNFTLTVNNTNDAPIITSTDQLMASEDSLYSALYYASDIDKGDHLTWNLTTNTSSWLRLDPVGGVLTGIPTNDDVGKYWVNVTVKDLAGTFDYHNFTLMVENTNDVPLITSIPILNAISAYSYIYDVNATDVDVGNVLTYSLDTKPVNMTIVPTSGLIEWTPTMLQGGSNHVVVNVSDGHCSVTQAFDITVVVPTVFPPVVTLLSPPNAGNITTTNIALSWSWKDPDSNNLSFDIYLGKVRADVEAKDPLVNIAKALTQTAVSTPDLEKGTTYYWTVIPNDGENIGRCTSGVWSFMVDWTAVDNKVPIITSAPVTTATVGKEYKYDVEAYDDDVGDVLNFSLSQWPDGMVIDAQSGLISWTPTVAQVGNQSITIKVSDGKIFASQSFKIYVKKEVVVPPVNHKPAINAIPESTIKAGDGFTYQIDATDEDTMDVLTYLLEGQPTGMTISSTGLISWTPTKDQVGEHTITINVSDGKDHTTAQFKITVEMKKTPGTYTGLDAMMYGIIAAIVIAIVVILVAVMALRGRRREEPEVTRVEKTEAKTKVVPKKVPTIAEKELEKKEPENKKAEPEIAAKLKDEIDLDDLED